MIHRGRHRYRTHAGIPQGSTNALGSRLSFYLQSKVGMAVGQWEDQSANTRHALQEVSGDQAAISTDGAGLLFVPGEGDHYDFDTQVEIAAQEGFSIFFVCKLESHGSNQTVLGLNNLSHFLEFQGGADTIRIKLGEGAQDGNIPLATMSPGAGNENDFVSGEKFLVVIKRDPGGTGNLHLYKNGVLLAQDSQAANPNDGEFISLGVRNGDRFLDGTIYDILMVEAGEDLSPVRDRITAYLMGKHGLV